MICKDVTNKRIDVIEILVADGTLQVSSVHCGQVRVVDAALVGRNVVL